MYEKVKHGKERRKACVLWCPRRKKTRFRRTGLVKSEKATGRSSYTTARHNIKN